MHENDEFTIHSRDDGQWEVHWPDGRLLAVYGSREEAELVASTPELAASARNMATGLYLLPIIWTTYCVSVRGTGVAAHGA